MYKNSSALEYNLASKQTGLSVLKKFYQKINVQDIDYYINIKSCKINEYLESSIIESKDVELTNMINSYVNLCKIKFCSIQNNLLVFPHNLNVCFTDDKVYWDNIFTIDNIIYCNYEYIKDIFLKTEYSDYKKVSEVYIKDNQIYDLELIKQLFRSITYISIYNNILPWLNQITNNLGIWFMEKNNLDIKLNPNHIIYLNPNTHYLDNFYLMTNVENKDNIIFNLIEKSNYKFNPYISSVRFELDDNQILSNPKYSNIPANPIVLLVDKICSMTFL